MSPRPVVWAALLTVAACDAGAPRSTVDPGLDRRIAQAQAEARDQPEALVQLGQLQLEAGRLFEASESFLAAREQGVSTADVDAGLAQSYVRLGYVSSAVDALRKCFAKAPQQADCLFAFASLIERDPSENAQREAQRTWARFLLVARADHPKRPYAESALAQLRGRFGELSPQALAGPPPTGGPTAAAGSPDGPSVPVPGHGGGADGPPVAGLNPFGQALQKAYRAMANKDAAAAVAAFESALVLRPDDPTTLAGLAEAQMSADDMPAAIATAEKAWGLAPTDPQVRYAFGLVMLRNQRRGREALQAWQKLLADSPEFAKRLGVDKLLESASPKR